MPRAWDRLSPKVYVRLQESLLRDLIRRFLYPFSPFYRGWFDRHGVDPNQIQGIRDLEAIPPVSRSDLDPVPEDGWRPFRALLRPEEGALKAWANRRLVRRLAREKLVRGDEAAERLLAEEFKPVHLHPPFEGGPVVGYAMRDLSAMSQAGARALTVMGADRADVLVSSLPLGPRLPFWSVYYGALGLGMAGLHLGSGEAVRPATAANWMDLVGATVLVAEPGYAEGFLQGAPPEIVARLRIMALWTDATLSGARERFTIRLRAGGATEAWVGTILGVPEARVAWTECPTPPGLPEASNGYHTYPDLELLEVVDGQGHPVGPGQAGEILYTSLDWRGSALLRFRTGLVARRGMTRAVCPGCLRSVPRIEPDISRVEWRTGVTGPDEEVIRVDLADVVPVLWRASAIPLWQLELIRGGGRGGTADVLVAHVGGAVVRDDVEDLQRSLLPFGVRVRTMAPQELAVRMGLGTERPEARVVIREAAEPEP